MPFNANYDIGMNGGNPAASQWFKLNISVNENGSIVIQNTLDNDTLRGWSGSYRFDFKELTSPNTDALLFSVTSPIYQIGPKPPGQHVMQRAADINLNVDPQLAQRFIARPSMYGVGQNYTQGDWLFDGSGALAQQIGQAVLTAAVAAAS
jgi:hypothetical protein